MLRIETLHHVSLPVTDVKRAVRFYREVLGLEEIARPPFAFGGAWFAVGDRQLHLIEGDDATFRRDRRVDSRDIHLAIRVSSFREAVAHLRSKGYNPDASDERHRTFENPSSVAGFPQVYVMDPDRNVIEINAAVPD
jgi:catechol 2,3-dioxygenase-like lactoylglutathione lyase family enzyme